MRVGWARPSVRADTELGADELAYVFNGFKAGPKSCYVPVKIPMRLQFKSVNESVLFFRPSVGIWEWSPLGDSGSLVMLLDV